MAVILSKLRFLILKDSISKCDDSFVFALQHARRLLLVVLSIPGLHRALPKSRCRAGNGDGSIVERALPAPARPRRRLLLCLSSWEKRVACAGPGSDFHIRKLGIEFLLSFHDVRLYLRQGFAHEAQRERILRRADSAGCMAKGANRSPIPRPLEPEADGDDHSARRHHEDVRKFIDRVFTQMCHWLCYVLNPEGNDAASQLDHPP